MFGQETTKTRNKKGVLKGMTFTLEPRQGWGQRKGQGREDMLEEHLLAWCAFEPEFLRLSALNKRWPRHAQTLSIRGYPVPERGQLGKGVR
jgi:hypothetical protein